MLKPPALLWMPLLLAVAACGPEPHERPGTWRATGANEANLRAMLAEPSHLTRGAQPASPSRGETAAPPVARLIPAAAPAGGGESAPLDSGGGGQGGGAAAGGGVSGIPALPPPGGNNVRR